MQKEFLDELVIESINKKLNGKEGIIFLYQQKIIINI